MTNRVKEEPGFLEGLGKEFFNDIPYNPSLTRAEQTLKAIGTGNELALRSATSLSDIRSEQRGQLTATFAVAQAVESSRRSTERTVVPLLSDIAASNMAADGRLAELESALSTGLEKVSGEIEQGTEAVVGIPTKKIDIDELINIGRADETELIVLAMRGTIRKDQAEKLFGNLERWKIDLLRSGLVANPNLTAERKLSGQERLFLAEVRRKSKIPTAHFGSLSVVARHGLCTRYEHFALLVG